MSFSSPTVCRFYVRSHRQQRGNTISVFWQTRPSPRLAFNPSSAVDGVHYSFCSLGLVFNSVAVGEPEFTCKLVISSLALFSMIRLIGE
ncbi:hypothetical protein D3C80_538730 [compost metagenome]